MADSTLSAIRTKVRRLTRSPNTAQITDNQIDEYVNTFILYDFPEQIRLATLRTTLTWYTQPGVDTYETENTVVTNALYNFKNKYVCVHPPVYIAGIPAFYTQWRNVFYGYYPQTNAITNTNLVGDGVQVTFTGTATARPMIQNNVIVTAIDISGVSMVLIDNPISNVLGLLSLPNQPQTGLAPGPYGNINYLTGAFTVTFPVAVRNQEPIVIENIAYQPGKPVAMLFYDTKFTIRPVPDKAYPVQIEVDVRPTELLLANESPDLEQWWQYIAYGASKKIFEDRMDLDSVQMIMPELKLQERLCLRSTLTLQANERTVTIYTQGKSYGFGFFGSGGWPY
jgi:hypothetical protein